MNPLLAPIELPLRILSRGYEAATETARAGRRLAEAANDGITLLDRLDRRAERFIEVVESIDAKAGAVLELGERIEASARGMLDIGAKIEARGGEMSDLGREIVTQANLVQERAGDVVEQASQLVAIFPTMKRAVEIVEPLEGTVDVLGRVADRLTGSRLRADAGPAGPVEPDADTSAA